MNKKLRHIASAIAASVFLFIAIGSDDSDSSSGDSGSGSSSVTYSNGEGQIKHNTANDWDKDATYRNMGEKVWKFSIEHPDATKLTLVITDECKDSKGEISNYETTILFNSADIREYSTYKESYSFNKNCYEFGIKLLEWRPCGNSPF